MDLAEFVQPLLFSSIEFDEALDNVDIADPHRRADEVDDTDTAPVVNAPFELLGKDLDYLIQHGG